MCVRGGVCGGVAVVGEIGLKWGENRRKIGENGWTWVGKDILCLGMVSDGYLWGLGWGMGSHGRVRGMFVQCLCDFGSGWGPCEAGLGLRTGQVTAKEGKIG